MNINSAWWKKSCQKSKRSDSVEIGCDSFEVSEENPCERSESGKKCIYRNEISGKKIAFWFESIESYL